MWRQKVKMDMCMTRRMSWGRIRAPSKGKLWKLNSSLFSFDLVANRRLFPHLGMENTNTVLIWECGKRQVLKCCSTDSWLDVHSARLKPTLSWKMCQAGVVAQQRWVCTLCDSQCICSEAYFTYQTDTTNLGGCYSTIERKLAEVFYLVRPCPVLLNFWINCKMCNWTNSFFPSTASFWSYGSRSQVHVQHTLVYKLLSHPGGNSVFKVG